MDIPADVVKKALERSWELGQKYADQGNSNSYSTQNKARRTQEDFLQLLSTILTDYAS